MMVNVGFDLFLSNCTNRATKIAARPQMLPPVTFLERWKLILQFTRRNTFDELGNLGWREGRRTRYHQMNMITADMSFQNGDFAAGANLSDNFSRSLCHFTPQHLIAIF